MTVHTRSDIFGFVVAGGKKSGEEEAHELILTSSRAIVFDGIFSIQFLTEEPRTEKVEIL